MSECLNELEIKVKYTMIEYKCVYKMQIYVNIYYHQLILKPGLLTVSFSFNIILLINGRKEDLLS